MFSLSTLTLINPEGIIILLSFECFEQGVYLKKRTLSSTVSLNYFVTLNYQLCGDFRFDKKINVG